MPGITATIITLNESANLAAALESVRWADEIIVVDAESTDDTTAVRLVPLGGSGAGGRGAARSAGRGHDARSFLRAS